MQPIGEWDNANGLNIYQTNMWKRRNNFHGAEIRWTAIKYPVLSPKFVYDDNGNARGEGFLMDLMYMYEKELNFTVVLSESVDRKFGNKIANGSFNGMVGMLVRNETDIVAAHMTITKTRSEVIDYCIPWKFSVFTLIAPVNRGAQLNYLVYMEVWRDKYLVWGLILASVLLFGLIFYVISQFGPENFHDDSHSDVFGLVQSGAFSAFFYLQLTYRASVTSTAWRIAFITASMCAYVLFSYWTADLTAGMTTGPRNVPIKNFQDIIDNDYTVITRPSTANSELLKTAREGTPMLKVWNDMKDDESKFHIKISDALNIIDNDPKTLFWAPDTNILGNTKYEWLKIEDAVYTQAGFGVQQNSEYQQLFDYYIGEVFYRVTHLVSDNFPFTLFQ